MSEQIKNIRLKFSCTADWAGMPVVEGVKSCEHCQKKVYDFTSAKQDEFLKILAENKNNVCGRFSATQMAGNHSVLPAWKKWVSAALVLVGINLFNNKVEAQKSNSAIKKVAVTVSEPVLGFVGVDGFKNQAHFIGGDAEFNQFVAKNLHYTKGMVDGKVIVNFNINKEGKLCDFKIIRSVSELNDKEVLRVLKSSPKWQPTIYGGKPVITSFTLPISFKK